MSRRGKTKFVRRKNDFYRTPASAVLPLIPFLKPGTLYSEVCAGDGLLIDHLSSHGMICHEAYDIDPRRQDIKQRDLLDDFEDPFEVDEDVDCVITNPPWTRKLLHPMIELLCEQKPTWLLFDAGWKHTAQATPYLKKCVKIVTVGRVSWMFNGQSGVDDSAFYLFDPSHPDAGAPRFYGKGITPQTPINLDDL